MRRSTFAHLNNQAAYSFGVIDHRGPTPKAVLRQRLEYASTNWDRLPMVAHSGASGHRVRERMRYLLSELEQQHGPQLNLLGTAGASVRNGLYTAERFFLNSVIEWDREPANRFELLRSALVGNSEEGELSANDKLIANIVADPADGSFVTIHLRILQFLFASEGISARRNVRSLIPLLRACSPWTTTEIRRSINYLLSMRRPLVWVDAKSNYSSDIQLLQCDDTLTLTEAGRYYLTKLIKELTYFQEAAMAVEWPLKESLAAPKHTDLIGRFALIRTLLRTFMERDVAEMKRFVKWADRRDERQLGIRVDAISVRVLCSIALSFASILEAWNEDRRKLHQTQEEIRNWASLLVLGSNILADLGIGQRWIIQVQGRYAALMGDQRPRRPSGPRTPPDAS